MRFPSFLAVLVAVSLGSIAPLRADPAIQHRFLVCDYSGKQVCIVGRDGGVEWRVETKAAPNECWLLPNGDVLFTELRGVREVNMAKETVWEYKAPAGVEVHSAQPLPDGNVLVLECGTKRIVEVNRAGEIVKEVPLFPKPGIGVHGQFRSARKLASGNYVVSFLSEGKVAEVDPSGQVVREQKVPGQPHEIVPLKNGNWLVTCGDGHRVMEFTPQGGVAWELAENDLPGNPLRWVAGAQRLPNGNTLLCNWLGHGHIGKNPHIYEVTPDKQLVWSFADHALFKAISQVQLLDDDVVAAPWEVQR
jgi:hypothetical protein